MGEGSAIMPDTAPKVGRNEPCPCGSGLKYKNCCRDLGLGPAASEVHESVMDEIENALAQQSFDSMEDLQAFMQSYQQQRNNAPMDDFQGLSPEQMRVLLNAPLDQQTIVTIPSELTEEPEAPLADLFRLLADAIGEKGLKPTAKGNLPRNTCREILYAHLGDAGYAEHTRVGNINWEMDAMDLHITRVIGELAGLIRKYKGRFILSRPARRMRRETGMRELYPILFRTFLTSFNWAYPRALQEAPFLQQSSLFTAYLIDCYGDEERPATFYIDRFRRAFPAAADEMSAPDWSSPERELAMSYTNRCLERFAAFTGLAIVRSERPSDQLIPDHYVRGGPMRGRILQFVSA